MTIDPSVVDQINALELQARRIHFAITGLTSGLRFKDRPDEAEVAAIRREASEVLGVEFAVWKKDPRVSIQQVGELVLVLTDPVETEIERLTDSLGVNQATEKVHAAAERIMDRRLAELRKEVTA